MSQTIPEDLKGTFNPIVCVGQSMGSPSFPLHLPLSLPFEGSPREELPSTARPPTAGHSHSRKGGVCQEPSRPCQPALGVKAAMIRVGGACHTGIPRHILCSGQSTAEGTNLPVTHSPARDTEAEIQWAFCTFWDWTSPSALPLKAELVTFNTCHIHLCPVHCLLSALGATGLSFNPQLCGLNTIFTPILQMRKQRHREVKTLAPT